MGAFGGDPFVVAMTKAAGWAFALAVFVAIITYRA